MSTAHAFISWSLVACCVLFSRVALGQQQICVPVTVDELRESLDRIDALIVAANLPAAFHDLSSLRRDTECLEEPIPRTDLARFAQMNSLVAFFDQDEEATRRWGLVVALTDPALPWPSYAPEIFVEAIDALQIPPLAGPEDVQIAHSNQQVILANGQVLEHPTARIEVPWLAQIVNRKGNVEKGSWQDGAAFADELVSAEGDGTPPKWVERLGLLPASMPLEVSAGGDEDSPQTDGEPTIEIASIFDVGQEHIDEQAPSELDAAPRETGWLGRVEEKDWMSACPWAGDPVVASATMTTITVNGHIYNVRGKEHWSEFRDVLRDCHQFTSARRLVRWRRSRQSMNAYAGASVALPIALYTLPAAIAAGIGAGLQRRALVTSLGRAAEVPAPPISNSGE